ncbi:MAG: PEP-CTERM sorting domain-containing protein [Planctomycetota bacterium]
MLIRTSQLAVAAVAVAGLTLTATSAHAQNLLTSPGFELSDNTVETGGPPTGWSGFGANFVNQVLPRTGDNAFKTFGTASGVFQEFPALPGQMWEGSAWATNPDFDPMAADQVAAVNIEWRDAGDNLISFDTTVIVSGTATPADSNYVLGEVSGTAPAGTAVARLVLITGAFEDQNNDGEVVGGGAPYFDDASFSLVIPEPASLGLLSLAGLGLVRRRRA